MIISSLSAVYALDSASLENQVYARLGDTRAICQTCADGSYIFFNIINTPNSTTYPNTNITLTNGQGCFNYTFNNLGRYDFLGFSDGCDKNFAFYRIVTTTGLPVSAVQISAYIFFLLICLAIMFLSLRLVTQNPIQQDNVDTPESYELKKRNELKFYLGLLKQKMWIIGVFGVYLTLLLFLALLNQLVYSLGIIELNNILNSFIIILGWGLIPFVLFLILFLLLTLFTDSSFKIRSRRRRRRCLFSVIIILVSITKAIAFSARSIDCHKKY
jgi:hypothetical protein